MSRFFVGQRIKKVRGDINVGVSGTVHGFDLNDSRGRSLIVVPDRPWVHVEWGIGYRAGQLGWALPSEWEPILPEGMKPARWEDCLWQPEHMRESARG